MQTLMIKHFKTILEKSQYWRAPQTVSCYPRFRLVQPKPLTFSPHSLPMAAWEPEGPSTISSQLGTNYNMDSCFPPPLLTICPLLYAYDRHLLHCWPGLFGGQPELIRAPDRLNHLPHSEALRTRSCCVWCVHSCVSIYTGLHESMCMYMWSL